MPRIIIYNYQRWSRGHKARGQGQGQPFRGQTLSRPRTGMLEAKDQGHKRKKKGLHKNFSGNLQKKKRFPKNVSGASQNFNNSKNSAVLEPRTGQFSRTWGLEAKDLTFEAKDVLEDSTSDDYTFFYTNRLILSWGWLFLSCCQFLASLVLKTLRASISNMATMFTKMFYSQCSVCLSKRFFFWCLQHCKIAKAKSERFYLNESQKNCVSVVFVAKTDIVLN